MYNIIQLNDKDLSELQQIAKELGLKKPVATQGGTGIPHSGRTSYRRCNQKGAAAKANEERKEGQPRKRSRISVKKKATKCTQQLKTKHKN